MQKMVKPQLVTLALLLIAAILVFTSSEAHAAANKAKADKASAFTGQTIIVEPLNNDRIKNKNDAVVKVTPVTNVKATVTNKRLVILKSSKPGIYKVKYQVFVAKKKVSTSLIVFTVEVKNTTPTLTARINALPVKAEVTSGYDRDLFKHWNVGVLDDGCDTRREVLVIEATVKPTVGASCSFTGGEWYSYYDGLTFTDSAKLDLDHVVALAEAWGSGASTWTPERREAYANDQGDSRSLVAVSASSNRSKSDRDPAEWMPPLTNVHCRYITDWVAVKTRWGLSVDQAEKTKLQQVASTCPNTPLEVTVWAG